MEAFPATGECLDATPEPWTPPPTRRTSRGSSSSPSRSSSTARSQTTDLTTPEITKLPALLRPRLLAEVSRTPSQDSTVTSPLTTRPEEGFDALLQQKRLMGTTSPLTRYRTTEALRPPPSHSTQSKSTFYSPALGSSNLAIPRRTSPPRYSTTERDGSAQEHLLYPPRGDGRKRAASLDDLLLIRSSPSTAPSIPSDFPLPLPAVISLSPQQSESLSGTTNRAHGVRRWHSLMELVSTEEGYVKDLKILVRIYLEHLPSVVALEVEARKEIARNAEALLSLHKKICRRLQRVISEERVRELGSDKGSAEAERRVNKAVSRVASIFVKEAASFHLYEEFCAGHSQALDIIRQLQGLPEWDMYEKRCAVIAADEQANVDAFKSPTNVSDPPSIRSPIVRSPSSPLILHSRRHSTDVAPKVSVALPGASKLTMTDFLIKPIQRICRYPLILGQMQSQPPTQGQSEGGIGFSSLRSLQTSDSNARGVHGSSSHTQNGDLPMGRGDLIRSASVPPGAAAAPEGVEAQALEAMKLVATKVDEARRKTDVAIKSRLIVERIPDQVLPQLTSLGNCLLAGSLDVVYHHETVAPLTTPIKVKYLGVFLYDGWVLIVKVSKSKVYEPRHWFPLLDVYLTDIAEDDALLPSSFRISSGEHHFEIAAACAQEKTVWMDHIRQARAKLLSKDLPSSLEDAIKPMTPIQMSLRTPSKKGIARNSLPPSGGVFPTTIPPFYPTDVIISPPKRGSSLNYLEGTQLLLANPGLAQLVTVDGVAETELPASPTSISTPMLPRTPIRSATTSSLSRTPNQIKLLLEGDASTILIRRASTNYRKMVDQSLQDVFSEECQAVRIAAQMKAPLFQPPKLTVDSGSGLSARNRMTKRDSVLLKRQKSVADAPQPSPGVSPVTRSGSASRFSLVRNKSAGAVGSSKESRRRTLMIPSFSFFEEREEERVKPGSRPNTADGSTLPVMPIITPDDNSPGDGLMMRPKRQRAKQASGPIDGTFMAKELPDKSSRPSTIHAASTTEFKFLKELPPTPEARARRRNTMHLPSSLNFMKERPFSTLPNRQPLAPVLVNEHGQRPIQVYSVGQGLTNQDPVNAVSPQVRSRLHPDTLIRKSLAIFSKRNRSTTGGYIAGFLNRSAVNVAPDRDMDSNPALRSRSEPPASPNRFSSSTPALKEALTNWELVPGVGILKHSDTKATKPSTSQSSCSTDVPSPFNSRHSVTIPSTLPLPIPALPRHNQTLQPAKSSLRRRSSQLIQHLNPFPQPTN